MVFVKDVHPMWMIVKLEQGDGAPLSLLSLDAKEGKGLDKQLIEIDCFSVTCYS